MALVEAGCRVTDDPTRQERQISDPAARRA
ncbi:hypothetical protein ABIA33_002348 [Streptacidiphilus sp. MAP12-16]